ncbi:hypothetical protein AYI68_g3397 [Smittium mucronatum]|uniref:Uncharacterized protein n=1 Tax=Smittium mucronatum TaxID=133383 RepID=A0A1R0H006_9FUNG|nr:hypothetical protein AYI68_g3397 [Smittium mucronatum]
MFESTEKIIICSGLGHPVGPKLGKDRNTHFLVGENRRTASAKVRVARTGRIRRDLMQSPGSNTRSGPTCVRIGEYWHQFV